jgi:PAS domain S-box-containing protein
VNYIFEDPSRDEETKIVLQSAIESANDAIIITELNLEQPGPRIEYVNPAFTRMTQYAESEAIGQSPRILQGPKTSRELLDRLRQDLLAEQSFHGETVNYRKDGSEYFVEWRITPVRDHQGKPIKWLAVQRDVTDRVRSESNLRESESHLRTANQDLEQFVYSASHDLQEPIRNVAIHTALIERRFGTELTPELQEHFQYVQEGAKRVGDLVKDLLAYTRASKSEQATEPESVDAEQVLQEVLQDLRPIQEQTNAQISFDRLPRVQMSSVHLQQIFQNLLTNALKYRKPDVDPVIHINTVPEGTDQIRFAVQDNGIGIAPEYHRQIFGVFRRLHDRSLPGTGIGLAITQRILERYRQRIWLQSELGHGSTFFFTVSPAKADA